MNKNRQDQLIYSDDDLNEQINDKLSQLWTGMKNKRKQMIRNLTPSYSRRSERTLSQLNSTQNQNTKYDQKIQTSYPTHNQTGFSIQHHNTTQSQLLKVKQKLASQQSAIKNKQIEIQRLKNTISQLTNDKKILFSQLQNIGNNSVSIYNLNQSSIDHLGTTNVDPTVKVDGKTASFSTNKKRAPTNTGHNYSTNYGHHNNQLKKDKSYTIMSDLTNKQNKVPNRQQNSSTNKGNGRSSKSIKNKNFAKEHSQQYEKGNLQDLQKSRLIQLLKSTSQYRQFAFYYDSHQLSYLKRLQSQHKKNCTTNYSKIQQRYWAPSELIQIMKNLNKSSKMNLTQTQVQQIVSQLKCYFQANQNLKIQQLREHYQRKIQKLKRQKTNNIPYDLVRLSNAKQRQISQIYKKRNNKSLKN